MARQIIHTDAAPAAIGTYSQAVRCGHTVYLSGQIPLDPKTMAMNNATFEDEVHQVFRNLDAVAKASGATLADVAKLNIFLTDLAHFATVNEIMAQYRSEEHTSELQSLMRISYAVFCLKNKKQ